VNVLRFGRSPREDLEQLRRLRELTGETVRLRWQLAGVPLFPLRTHVHLVPPEDGTDAESAAYASSWREGYRYGSFFYRAGPGFVLVKDIRPGDEPTRMTIDEGAAEFLTLASASTVGDLDAGARELVDTAEEAGLLLRHDDRLLVLPYRIQRWPVPYLAV
jgi:hypothetical protein